MAATAISAALFIAACADSDDDAGEPNGASEVAESTEERGDPVATAEQRVADAENGVTQADEALTEAHGVFCSATEGYVASLDRYGRLFTDEAATVGDIQTLGADLVEPRDDTVSAAGDVQTAKDNLAAASQELVDAEAALAAAIATASSVPLDTEAPESTTTTTLVPQSSIDRVEQAEQDLNRVSNGITAETPLTDAAADYNSAALAVQVSWLALLADANCLTDEQQSNAVAQITAYTKALQTDLTTAGYDPGGVDGIYGPSTVAAVEQLQKDSGLRETGLMDEATSRALADKVVAAGQAEAQQTIVLQTVLSALGYWNGPIDGVWTPELTEALKQFQIALGIEPTGVVDAATLAAFEQAFTEGIAGTPPPSTDAPPATTPPPVPPTTLAP